MKKILLFFLLVISVHAQSQKTVTPNWVKSVAQDTATVLRAEIALKMNSSAFADSFNNRFSATSIAAIKEVAEYEPVIADSSILLYSGGVWSIFDLSEALSATANNAITITYPDVNTISFNDTDVLLLDPLTLEINGSNQLTVKFSNLSNNTIPYNNTSTGLADSRISQDANTTYIRGGSTATSLGSELLTNGTFDTDLSGWTAGAGWSWDSGTAKHTTGNTATLEQSFSTSNIIMYQVVVTITGRTAGSITLSFNNGQQSYAGITATGTYHILSTLTGSNKIIITPTTDFNGSMDAVSVKLLTSSLPAFIVKNTDNSNSGLQIRTGNSANNFYFGIDAGKNNTTGIYNSAIGYQALLSNTIGQFNSAIGYQALRSNTSGYYNSAIGYQALRSNTSGYYNSAIGRDALYSNTTGSYNSAIGRDALYSNTTGNYNSAIGYFALRSIVGQGNIGISYQAGRYNADNSEHTTGNFSNYFGYDTKASTNGVSNENVFGYQAVGMGSNTFVFGSNAITDTYLKGKVHINNDLDVAGYGYFADSIVVGNSTVKIYPDSITIGGIKVNPSGGSGIDTAKVNDLIKDYNDSTGVSIIGTQGTLDSLITDYWNDNLGSGTWDSTYAYQRITALESTVTSLQNSINNILAALDTCGCSAVVEDNTPPLAPTSYVAIGGTSQTQYVTTWTDPVDADLSKIYWYEGSANDSTTLALVDSINAGVQTYTRTGRTANTTYWSAVKAVDDSGNVSWFSNLDSATTQSTGGASPIATLDFEEGDLSEWSSTSGANLSASTTFAHTGTYSMRVGTNSYGIYNFTSDTEVWLTFWIYLPSTSSQSASYNYISMFNNGIADRSCFGTNNGTWSEWLVGVNSGNMTDNDYTTNFSQDTWHKVKIYYQTNGTTTSQHQVWVDDTSIWSTTAAYVNSVSNFTVGSEAATITNYFYIDDIKLYTSDPGTQD